MAGATDVSSSVIAPAPEGAVARLNKGSGALRWRSLLSKYRMNTKASSESSQSIARHAGVYAAGNIIRQLAGFLMLPIYTQHLSPADYGAVGLLALAMAVLEPFFGARLTQAVPRFYFLEKGEHARQAVITSALTLTAAVSAVTALLIWVFSRPASELLFGTSEYALATALFGLNMLTQPVEYSGMTFIRMQQRSTLFLGISMVKLAVQIGLNLLLVVHLQMGVVGVVLSGVIASTIFGFGLTVYTFYYNRPRFDFSIVIRMLKYSWPLWIAGLAGLYTGSSGRLFLRIFGSLDAVGLIELGTRFASILSLLVWAPFSQHWDTISYKLYAEKKAEGPFQLAFIVISTLLLVTGLGISIFSDPAIELMAAESFQAAAATVPLLTLAFLFSSLSGLFAFSFMVTDNTRLIGYSQYFMAVVITVLFLLLIPQFKEVGAALAQCLASVATFYFIYKLSLKYFDAGIRLERFWIGVGICTASYLTSNLLVPAVGWWLEVAIKVVIYTVACTVLVWLCITQLRQQDPVAYDSLRQIVRRATAFRSRTDG